MCCVLVVRLRVDRGRLVGEVDAGLGRGQGLLPLPLLGRGRGVGDEVARHRHLVVVLGGGLLGRHHRHRGWAEYRVRTECE